MSARVLAPGLHATVQDGGRHGFRHLGVGSAGALDPYSHAVANLLVGNRVDAPVLEAALAGPSLRFERPARIALCGATVDARVADVPIPGWRPVDLPAGSELHVGRCRDGARIYLAVAGGWSVPTLLGSGSTDLRGGFRGACDRQGLRLEGVGLALDPRSSAGPERVSEPVAPGTVQLPAGGQPIVLLADAQTHGGYPRIGHAIASDLPRLAQLRPGDTVRFAPCTPVEAARLRREQAHRLARIAVAVGARQWGA